MERKLIFASKDFQNKEIECRAEHGMWLCMKESA